MLRVASFYRFAPVAAPDALAGRLADHARGLRGTILVASEGINGSLAGDAGTLAAFRARIEGEPGLAGLPWTEGAAEAMPFDRLRIRLRREIVTMGIPGVDPAAQTGTAVDPADWNALIAAPDLVTIDTRNAYEVRLGSFEGAIDPGTAGFRDFPGWWQRNRATLEGRRVAMFCTGGIRCEKASSWLLAQGMAAVFQLRGGILAYLAAIPPTQSRWQGDCFVFDGRVAVGHGLV
ncbi:MAG: rhodanese-related sulfurtransferase, partial [Gemmobacter sp.]